MKTLIVSFVLVVFGLFLKPGEPVESIEVFLEQDGKDTPVAFQLTGENGKVTFSNLSRGLYRIKVILPQQYGKLMRGKDETNCQLMVGFHNDKQEYFIREDEGFFTICYSSLKKIEDKSITPVYNLDIEDRSKRVEIGKFEVSGNNGSFTMQIRAQKPKTFAKMVEKVRNDIGMVTIKNAV